MTVVKQRCATVPERADSEKTVCLVTSGHNWAGFSCVSLDVWLAENQAGLRAPLPLGLLIDAADYDRLSADMIAALRAAHVPVAPVTDPAQDAVTLARWAGAQVQYARQQVNDLRRANAALRVQHETMQRNFDAAEGWLHMMQAPRFVRLRHFPFDQQQAKLAVGQPLQQTLPAAARGLAAVDFWAVAPQGGAVTVRICDNTGANIAQSQVSLAHGISGWQRAQFSRAIGGLETDVYAEFHLDHGADIALGLALPSATLSVLARCGPEVLDRPLAMTLWGGLPEVTLPAIGYSTPAPTRYVLPIELPTPVALRGVVDVVENPGMLALRAEDAGTGAAVMRNVDFAGHTQSEAFVQILGDDGATVTIAALAPGVISERADLYRLDTGQFIPANQPARIAFAVNDGCADLVVRLENAHPGSVLHLWALRLDNLRA